MTMPFLHIYQHTCFAPRITGTIHSGSVACILSSIKIEWNFSLASLGSPAPTHVQHITSAASNNSFSAAFFNIRYRFSSTEESSPVSSFNCWSFCSSVLLLKNVKCENMKSFIGQYTIINKNTLIIKNLHYICLPIHISYLVM